MAGNKCNKLGSVLTREQLIKAERILSCDVGMDMRMAALWEYFRRPEVSKDIKESGWDPYILAYITTINYDRQRDTEED